MLVHVVSGGDYLTCNRMMMTGPKAPSPRDLDLRLARGSLGPGLDDWRLSAGSRAMKGSRLEASALIAHPAVPAPVFQGLAQTVVGRPENPRFPRFAETVYAVDVGAVSAAGAVREPVAEALLMR